MTPDPSAALAKRMLEEGRISPALANAALDRHLTGGDRFEEALIECGLPESLLLRHLAEMFGTRYVSSKTLATASIPRSTLQRLSQRLAERYQAVPIRFAEDETLTVAMTEAGNAQLVENVRVATGARQVRSLVARPAAVRAAIAKFYAGDGSGFERLGAAADLLPSRPETGSSPPGQRGLEDGLADVQLDTSAFDQPAYPPAGFDTPAAPPGVEMSQPSAAQSFGVQPGMGPGSPTPVPASSAQAVLALGGNAAGQMSAASFAPSGDPPRETDEGATRARSAALGDASRLAESLMIIHERSRGSLKSHSVRVARLSYALCRQLDLSEPQAAHAWAIGLFHDLGKTQQHHLTALNVWQLADHEVAARAQFKNPGRLLKSADVPETVITAISHMYERYDGLGFPDGLAEEAIPFQSRVLALCDSIADLTLNPANTLGRIVSPLEACTHIRAQTPKVFDPTLLAHFSRLLVERKLDGAFFSEQSVHGIEKLLG